MEVIERSTSTPQPKQIDMAPRFEELITEDGILCLILSFLTPIEAVRTCVVSSRWRHIWTHLTKFNFNAVSVLDAQTIQPGQFDSIEAYNLTKGKTDKFIQTVYSVLQQFQGVRLDEFAVRYFLNKSHSPHLDAWVRLAVASQVKLLALHLFKPYWNSSIEPYDFPCHLLRSSRSIEIFSLVFCSLKLPTEFDIFGHLKLKRLVLIKVDISQEDFDRMLPNSYSTLERLFVCEAPQLVSITFPHPLNQLQNLFIRNCCQLRKIEINAVYLLKFNYNGYLVDFKFRQSSKLIDADISFKPGGTLHNLEFYLSKLSSNLAHLQKLTLKIGAISQMTDLPKTTFGFIHLRHLDWEWVGSTKMGLLDLATLMDAAPFLEELKLRMSDLPKKMFRFIHLRHLDWEWDGSTKMGLLDLATLMDAAPFLEELKLRFSQRVFEQPRKYGEMLPKRPHTHLKKIQVIDFCFDMWQIEIAAYLLKNATELESMTIEKGSTPPKGSYQRGRKILAREGPAKVKLVIL